MYKINYGMHFADLLEQTINYWQESLQISDEKIEKFVRQIEKSFGMLKDFPKIGQDVTKLYGFTETTYRILIGQKYAIFYRIDEAEKTINIGSFYSNKQMRLKF